MRQRARAANELMTSSPTVPLQVDFMGFSFQSVVRLTPRQLPWPGGFDEPSNASMARPRGDTR